MKNLYYNDMVEMLMSHPDGLRLRHIARVIYNSHCDLFDTAQGMGRYERIYGTVSRFLWSESRKQLSPFERRQWGLYALRRHFVVQLELCFDDWEDEGVDLSTPARAGARQSRQNLGMQDLFGTDEA